MAPRTNPFAPNPFAANPFGVDGFVAAPIPPAPETHEPRRALRSYLGAQGGGMDLSALLPGAPQPTRKVEVEKIREVEKASPAGGDDDEDGTSQSRDSMPKWGKG